MYWLIGSLIRLVFTLTIALPLRLLKSCARGAAAKRDVSNDPPPDVREEQATVLSVIDGDTIFVRRPGGQEEGIRLIGIDAMETSKNDRLVYQKEISGLDDETLIKMGLLGKEALRTALRYCSPDNIVTLEYDVERRDKYGRLLAYVRSADNADNINMVMIRAGFALYFPFPPNTRYDSPMRMLLDRAMDGRTGLFGPDEKWEGWYAEMRPLFAGDHKCPVSAGMFREISTVVETLRLRRDQLCSRENRFGNKIAAAAPASVTNPLAVRIAPGKDLADDYDYDDRWI